MPVDKIQSLIKREYKRQKEGLELIPSENYASKAVRNAMGSVLTNKYSEGYPNKRYYGGNEYIDLIEIETQKRAKKLFNVPYVNVQPYSGSPANFAVYLATCKPGDTIMGLNLPDGGHLTHGWKVSATALFFNSVPYHVTENGRLDIDEVWKLAKKHKPKLIWTGATAYVYKYDFESFAEIADSVGAYLASDIAHIAGLIVGGAHPSPVPFAHIVTTTTHKTLRGPRGGMIMVTDKGLKKDPELGQKIDKAIFPGFQGGPHNHQTAAIGIALGEDSTLAFKKYARQVVKNAKALATTLKKRGIALVGNGTENHMLLLDLVPVFGPGGGAIVEKGLDAIGLTVNKNMIPKDPSSPYYPSGIRLGTPAATTRNMKEKHMMFVGNKIADLIDHLKMEKLPIEKDKKPEYLKNLAKRLKHDPWIQKTFGQVVFFTKKFPLP
jgi:glycine hydroxymethyltransferase